MHITKTLFFCEGQRGMNRDLFHVQNSDQQLIREDVGGGRVQWSYISSYAEDGSPEYQELPVPQDVTLEILDLKPKNQGERRVMFSETGGPSSEKRYPFSWEAQEGAAK